MHFSIDNILQVLGFTFALPFAIVLTILSYMSYREQVRANRRGTPIVDAAIIFFKLNINNRARRPSPVRADQAIP